MSKGSKLIMVCDANGNFISDEPIKGKWRLLYASFTKILNQYPEYLFLYTNQDSNKSVIGNNFFTGTFFIKDNETYTGIATNQHNNKYKYKNADNYDQTLNVSTQVKNFNWRIFDVNNNEINVNDLTLVLEKK